MSQDERGDAAGGPAARAFLRPVPATLGGFLAFLAAHGLSFRFRPVSEGSQIMILTVAGYKKNGDPAARTGTWAPESRATIAEAARGLAADLWHEISSG